MPELPEVEIIVRDLRRLVPGLKIADVWSDIPAFRKIKKVVVGKKILGIERRGKNILIQLSQDRAILVHLKLTGRLLYNHQDRFVHLIFYLSNGKQLVLSDTRKFAKVSVIETKEIDEKLKKLGPEPLEPSFNFKKFQEILKDKRGKIKQVLMNQEIISGIGNIYSDEILWLAGVHPLRLIQKLRDDELKKIYQSIKLVLKRAIRARGSSCVDYRDALGRKGHYQKMHLAYQLTGTKCKRGDGGIIKKIKIGGRSAHFCPLHQKL